MNTAFQDLLGLVPEAADSELDGADEEELRAQLERDLEACEIILDVQEEVFNDDGAVRPSAAPPQPSPDSAAAVEGGGGGSEAWQAFLQSACEADQRFSAMQQAVTDCNTMMRGEATAAQVEEATTSVEASPAPAPASDHVQATDTVQDADTAPPPDTEPPGEDDVANEEAKEGEAGRLREEANGRLLQALDALGPSLQDIVGRARALVAHNDEEEEEERDHKRGGGVMSEGARKEPMRVQGPRAAEAERPGQQGTQGRPEEPTDIEPVPDLKEEDKAGVVGVPAVEGSGEGAEQTDDPMTRQVVSPRASVGSVLVQLQARQHEDQQADEQRRMREREERMRREEEEAAIRAEEERKAAAALRHRRREEARQRATQQHAAVRIGRAVMSALSRWNRRRALEEEKRRAEGRQRREREAMGREDRAMRQLLHKEARARQLEVRWMVEEERSMRLYLSYMAMEAERALYEARGMAAEEKLGRAVRQREERDREEVELRKRREGEERERRGMEREEECGRNLVHKWRAAAEERAVARAQRTLAQRLLGGDVKGRGEESKGDVWLGPGVEDCGGLYPPELEGQLITWAREQRRARDGHSGSAAMAWGHHQWKTQFNIQTHTPLQTAMPLSQPQRPVEPPKPVRAGPGVLTSDMLQSLGQPLGSLRSLELCVEGLSDVSALSPCTQLHTLSLNVNRLQDLRSLCVVPSVSDLSLKDNSLSSLNGIQALPHLTHLVLDINQLRRLDELCHCPGLLSVSANTNAISAFPPFPPHPLPLQRLLLYHNSIEHVPPERLRPLTSLTCLDLGRNRLCGVSGEGLSCCVSLTKLVLSQNKLSLPPSPLHLPLLRELWLSGNSLTSLQPWAPQPSINPTGPPLVRLWLPSLRVLFLQDNAITSQGLPPRSLSGCGGLEVLELSFNRLTQPHTDIANLATDCPQLTHIQLHDNEVSSSHEYLCLLLQHLPRLQEVDGQAVCESKRWHARSLSLLARPHLLLPFLRQLTRRDGVPLCVPPVLLSHWRHCPRPLTCLACTHTFAFTPPPSPPSLSPPVACPHCGSDVPHPDPSQPHPYPLQHTQVSLWHGYDLLRACLPPPPCPSPSSLPIAPLSRLLSRLCDDAMGGRQDLETRHRRLLPPPSQGPQDSTASPIDREGPAHELHTLVQHHLHLLTHAETQAHDGFLWHLHTHTPHTASTSKTPTPPSAVLTPRQRAAHARRIQALWRRFKSRAPSPLCPHTALAAVVKVQCTFRGFHVRRSLQAALDSAKYVDTSLDDLTPIDFDSFMPPPPQLESDWGVPITTSTPLTRHPRQPAACPPPSAALPCPHLPSSAAASGPFSPSMARPSSSSSHARLQPLYPSSVSSSPKALSEPNEGPHPPQPKPQTMLQEWGITDERLAHTLLHRRSKIRKLQAQQSKRENMKKSEYRYNKFVQHSRATTVPRSLASKEEGRAGFLADQPRNVVIGAGGRAVGEASGGHRPSRGRGNAHSKRDRRPAWASSEDGV